MSDRTSAAFQKTAANISAELRIIFRNEPGYRRSEVVRLEPGSVQATINNIFENSNVNQETVDNTIKEAIDESDGIFADATFTGTNLCEQEPLPCEGLTMNCTSKMGRAFCTCKPDFVPNVYSSTSCRACPSGKRAVDNKCEPCSFGYSGFNCNDSSLLAVVVVSCVLGGILLIILLAMIAYHVWKRCSNSKPGYNSSPYASEDTNQSFPNITSIPRASTNLDGRPSFEMTGQGALVNKNYQKNGLSGSYDLQPEGMKTFTGKNPSRYSYLVQGHENPYFLPGEGKKK